MGDVIAKAVPGLVQMRASRTSVTLRGPGHLADLMSALKAFRDKAAHCAVAAEQDASCLQKPELHAASLEKWSAHILRIEHADALLNALAGSIGPAVSSPSSAGLIARQGRGAVAYG
ncbi:hypothetical protein [Allobranchiibius huperziae]|uniref:Uncharacterized protein n=1 Tax=Allobranchiibius huperziae TaxID=1874116 RepID=A0A853DN96_9MICO|nr:hypothetical protein [Allobranchiibius huperziae]NYJ76464.1 hypothetical protein [Allobranchiibius huperziae]